MPIDLPPQKKVEYIKDIRDIRDEDLFKRLRDFKRDKKVFNLDGGNGLDTLPDLPENWNQFVLDLNNYLKLNQEVEEVRYKVDPNDRSLFYSLSQKDLSGVDFMLNFDGDLLYVDYRERDSSGFIDFDKGQGDYELTLRSDESGAYTFLVYAKVLSSPSYYRRLKQIKELLHLSDDKANEDYNKNPFVDMTTEELKDAMEKILKVIKEIK